MISIGIDIGLKGAMVAINEKLEVIEWSDTPLIGGKHYDVIAMKNFLSPWSLRDEDPVTVWIEAPQTRPKQSAQSGLKTGLGFGLWEGLCVGLELRYDVVYPQTWTKTMFRGIPKSQGKNRSLVKCQRLFPDLPLAGPRGGKKDGRSDAALIAAYGMTYGRPI